MHRIVSDRDHPLQSVRRQVLRCALWRHHVRGLQGVLPPVAVLGGELPVPPPEELRRGPRQPKPLPVLPPSEVSRLRHVQGRGEVRAHEQETAGKG